MISLINLSNIQVIIFYFLNSKSRRHRSIIFYYWYNKVIVNKQFYMKHKKNKRKNKRITNIEEFESRSMSDETLTLFETEQTISLVIF